MNRLLLLLALPVASLAAPYTLEKGDTLWDLAVSRYGDPSFVRELKAVNGIADPRVIGPQTPHPVIELPGREAMRKLRNAKTAAERQAVLQEIQSGGTVRPSASAAASPSPAAGVPVPEQPLDALAEPSVPSLAP